MLLAGYERIWPDKNMAYQPDSYDKLDDFEAKSSTKR